MVRVQFQLPKKIPTKATTVDREVARRNDVIVKINAGVARLARTVAA